MLSVDTPQDMKAHVGRELGVSGWLTVDQAMIDKFVDGNGVRLISETLVGEVISLVHA